MWTLFCVICLHRTKIYVIAYIFLDASGFEGEHHHVDGEDEGEEEQKVIYYSKGVKQVE